ncbi:hypothetical protein ScPMuIL_014421 [Solemya velum]
MVRVKFRYIVAEIQYQCEGETRTPIKDVDILMSVKKAVAIAHGDYGVGCMLYSLRVSYFKPQMNIVMIRVGRRAHTLVLTAMIFVKKIGYNSAEYKTLHLGGTMRSCHKFLLKYYRNNLSFIAGLTNEGK